MISIRTGIWRGGSPIIANTVLEPSNDVTKVSQYKKVSNETNSQEK